MTTLQNLRGRLVSGTMMDLLVPSDKRNLPPSVAALGRGNEALEATRGSAARDKSEGSLLDGSLMDS